MAAVLDLLRSHWFGNWNDCPLDLSNRELSWLTFLVKDPDAVAVSAVLHLRITKDLIWKRNKFRLMAFKSI